MKCLLLINTSSGNSQKAIDNKDLLEVLRSMYGTVDECRMAESDKDFDIVSRCSGYDALAVCGGDGTFNSAINATRTADIDLIYVPCGTLNDSAHTLNSIKDLDDLAERRLRFVDLGEFNNTLFTYVAATGSFTAIGFLPKAQFKKRFKRLVYYLYAFKEYKIHKINAKINVNGTEYRDVYTLIMAVKSKYVFGLGFNKIYKHNSGKGHLLLITAPKGLFKYIKLFFYCFRAFFIGFRKEKTTGKIKFLEFSAATVDFDEPQTLCLDGERFTSQKHNIIKFHKKKTKVFIP